MTDELQNCAWVSLPEDFKKEVREIYHNGLTPLSILRPFEKSRETECLEAIFGIHNLTAEEKPLSLGSKVIISKDSDLDDIRGLVGVITGINNASRLKVDIAGETYIIHKAYLTPYTEPEETKEETKEPDLTVLLKGCEGMEFHSDIISTPIELKSIYGNMLVFYLDKEDDCTIEFDSKGHLQVGTLDFNGCFKTITDPNSKCMLYPSKDVRTWDNWQPPKKRWKPKRGDNFYMVSDKGYAVINVFTANEDELNMYFNFGNTFRTREHAEEAAKRVREVLEKFHEEIGE